MTTKRKLEDRAAEIEATLAARRSTSEKQADYAIRNDNRDPQVDNRPDEELSASELQARALARPAGRRRGGRGWQAF